MRWLAVLVLMLVPGLAHGQGDDATRRAARNLGVSGVEAYEAKDYATAGEKLDKAYRVLKAPSLGLWSARALIKLNRLVEAAERYQEVMRLAVTSGDQAVQDQAKADAARELDQLSPQIPNVVVEIVGANPDEVSIDIDGSPMSAALIGEKRPVNPGRHKLLATSAGQTTSGEVELATGQTKTVTLRFAGTSGALVQTNSAMPATATPASPSSAPDEAPAQAGSSRRTLAFVAIGVGGAGLALGAVTGFLALGKKKEIDDNPLCKGGNCLRSEQSLVEGYNTLRSVSGAGLIAGAAIAAVGVVILVSAPKQPQQTALRFGPGSVDLSRSF